MSTNHKVLLTNSKLISAGMQPLQQIQKTIPDNNTGKSILISSLFAITLSMLLSWGTAVAQIQPPDAVKWHPGHYSVFASMEGKYKPTYRNEVYSDLKRTPALRGVVVRYAWGELETAKDVYNFSNIKTLLAELTAQKKRLIILFETKASAPGTIEIITPDYLNTDLYEKGFYSFTNDNLDTTIGHGIKLWNPNVYDRVVKLFRELGKQFNSNPYFEGIGLAETSMSKPLTPLSSNELDSYFKNLLSLNKQLRVHFPNTMTFQFANYPRPVVQSYVESFQTTGTAFGGPDVFIEEPGLLFPGSNISPPGAYAYHPLLSGTIPLVMQVAKLNYENTRWDRSGYKPTVSELLNFARNNLKANYIFWVRIPTYNDDVIEALNWDAQKSTRSGGLNAICPSVYPSCVN